MHVDAARRLDSERHLVSERRPAAVRRAASRHSARVLSARLKELERRGIVTRTVMATSPPSVEYTLTGFGHELVPAINSIARVGMKLKNRLG